MKRKPKMTRVQIVRTRSLLHMRYMPSELAKEIGCCVDTIYRTYLPAGCPNQRDDTGHIWIIGTEFAAWAREMFVKRRESLKMESDEGYCMKCQQPVKMLGPFTVKPTNRYLDAREHFYHRWDLRNFAR
jgi:hypothetical protein